MDGLDVFAFKADIGLNLRPLRKTVCEDLSFFRIEIDENNNDGLKVKEVIINSEDSKEIVLVIPTNDEFMVAYESAKIFND